MRNLPGGMQNFMKQAQQMQNKMAKTQEALKEMTIDVSSGGGAIKITMTGAQEIQKITIEKDVASDIDMLEDLVLTAVNEAVKKSKAMAEEEMNKVTGGLNMPGLF
ncbi:MAG: YbaB/EbfC family nucleoid-associated protein [Oligoflexia bacterium]|nr:YbaB/EbfC family nucleoid-associated protein [Oligoflexia bacterium]